MRENRNASLRDFAHRAMEVMPRDLMNGCGLQHLFRATKERVCTSYVGCVESVTRASARIVIDSSANDSTPRRRETFRPQAPL